jgi:hypothetical protein
MRYTEYMEENQSTDDHSEEQLKEILESEGNDDRDSEELKACGE